MGLRRSRRGRGAFRMLRGLGISVGEGGGVRSWWDVIFGEV